MIEAAAVAVGKLLQAHPHIRKHSLRYITEDQKDAFARKVARAALYSAWVVPNHVDSADRFGIAARLQWALRIIREAKGLTQEQLVDAFLEHLRDAGRSEHTIRNYRYALNEFVGFLDRNVDGWSWTAVTRSIVRAYQNHLLARGLKQSVSARKIRALRGFFIYLRRIQVIVHNPIEPARTSSVGKTQLRKVYNKTHPRA